MARADLPGTCRGSGGRHGEVVQPAKTTAPRREAHRHPTPFVRAIDASWHAPTSIILMDRAMHHGGPDDACVDILAWPWRQAALRPRRRYTGVVPFGLGGAPSCGFDGGTPVSPHELGYATPFVRANDVPL